MRAFSYAAVPVLAIVVAGCSVRVGRLHPRPDVQLERSNKRLALRIDSKITDVQHAATGPGLAVSDWRGTLTDGFMNAFGSAFRHDRADVDLTFHLLEATPVLVEQPDGTTVARVHYRARLLGPQKTTLARHKGVAVSKQAIERLSFDAHIAVRTAVEQMYEELAADFFAPDPEQ